MKEKTLTEEWKELKQWQERSSYDLSNPLADFLHKMPKKESEKLLDLLRPDRHTDEAKGIIWAIWRMYRRVRKNYFSKENEEVHKNGQRWAMDMHKRCIKTHIVKLRKLSQSRKP